MAPKTTRSDPAEYLGSEDAIIGYIDAWMEDGSPREIARALGDVARLKGITEISRSVGAGPQALYPALSDDGNPTLQTVTGVLDSLGLRLSVKRRAA
jgi:probable addiction module antidote protein